MSNNVVVSPNSLTVGQNWCKVNTSVVANAYFIMILFTPWSFGWTKYLRVILHARELGGGGFVSFMSQNSSKGVLKNNRSFISVWSWNGGNFSCSTVDRGSQSCTRQLSLKWVTVFIILTLCYINSTPLCLHFVINVNQVMVHCCTYFGTVLRFTLFGEDFCLFVCFFLRFIIRLFLQTETWLLLDALRTL